MSLNSPVSPRTHPPRQVPLALFAVVVIVAAAVSIGATATYFELHPNGPSVVGSNQAVVIGTIPVGAAPGGLSFDSGKGEVFVTNSGSSNVSVLSDASDGVAATVPVGAQPDAATYDPLQNEVFVTNHRSDNVSVISDATDRVVATIAVGTGPAGAAFDPARGEVFVANEGSNNVSVISDTTNDVVDTIPVGVSPVTPVYDPARGEIYVTDSGSNNVSVISDATHRTVTSVGVGSDPLGATYDARTAEIVVANAASDNLSAIADGANRVATTFGLGSAPVVVTAGTDGDLFVAGEAAALVSVISDATGHVVATLDVGLGPDGLAFDPAKGEVFVANQGSESVSVISDTPSVVVVDDLGRVVTVPVDPRRVVVLAPSVLDVVYRLGLRSTVVGVGCTASLPGGIYNEYSPNQTALWQISNASCVADFPALNTGDVALLGPQVVLTSTITSAQAVEQLTEVYGLPVVVLAPSSLEGIGSDVRIVAQIFPEVLDRATQLESSLASVLSNASALDANFSNNNVSFPTVLLSYNFDRSGYYTYGPGSFGDSLIALAGGDNIAASVPLVYAELNATVALIDQPQVILYGTSNDSYLVAGETPSVWSSAPYWSQLSGTKVALDVTLVTEADPSMILSLPLLMHLLHPTLVPPP